MTAFYEIGQLLDHLNSSFDSVANRPANLNIRTFVVVSAIYRDGSGDILVRGFVAEFLVDEKVSVIPTDANNSLVLDEILIPEQEFAFIVREGQDVRFTKFCGRDI